MPQLLSFCFIHLWFRIQRLVLNLNRIWGVHSLASSILVALIVWSLSCGSSGRKDSCLSLEFACGHPQDKATEKGKFTSCIGCLHQVLSLSRIYLSLINLQNPQVVAFCILSGVWSLYLWENQFVRCSFSHSRSRTWVYFIIMYLLLYLPSLTWVLGLILPLSLWY